MCVVCVCHVCRFATELVSRDDRQDVFDEVATEQFVFCVLTKARQLCEYVLFRLTHIRDFEHDQEMRIRKVSHVALP